MYTRTGIPIPTYSGTGATLDAGWFLASAVASMRDADAGLTKWGGDAAALAPVKMALDGALWCLRRLEGEIL